MTTMGWREQTEREVLATIITDPDFFWLLPIGFEVGTFELGEYRRLFQFIQESPGVSEEDLRKAFPDDKPLFDNILRDTQLLNGSFGSMALSLMNHQPFRENVQGQGKDERVALTEVGNSERFARQHSEGLRFNHSNGNWLIWNGLGEKHPTIHAYLSAKLKMHSQ